MICIRKANKDDSLDIANIHFTSWAAAYAELLPNSYISRENNLAAKQEMWQEIITHPNVSVWVAFNSSDKRNQDSLGFIGYFNKGNNYEITTLYVMPEYQNLGIGSKLMTTTSRKILASYHNITDSANCISNHSANVFLWVLEANVSAIEFYEKHGFIRCEESCEELYEGYKIVDIKMVENE